MRAKHWIADGRHEQGESGIQRHRRFSSIRELSHHTWFPSTINAASNMKYKFSTRNTCPPKPRHASKNEIHCGPVRLSNAEAKSCQQGSSCCPNGWSPLPHDTRSLTASVRSDSLDDGGPALLDRDINIEALTYRRMIKKTKTATL